MGEKRFDGGMGGGGGGVPIVGGSPTHGGVDHPGAIHGHVAPGARPLDGDNAEPHRDQIEESCWGGGG